ncbi:hypothetical protein GF360_02890 [candidate division WWE3 bacterium]|nr:hypothetical protein [candidate division WWE3 bacterium]
MGYINNKPHVNFEINKEMDYWTVKEFLTFDSKDTFSETILALHPRLKETKDLEGDSKIEFFNKYVDQVYEEKSQELHETQEKIQRKWNNVEDTFLDKAKELFNGHEWPEGAYVGFLSIFNCNPRFLNQKTFQVYYKHPEGPVYVGAHEMLHFMFYDYVDKHPGLIEDANDSLLWNLSEIFNVVILETPEFVDITGNHKPEPYKKHEDILPDFRDIWKESENVDEFIQRSSEATRSFTNSM